MIEELFAKAQFWLLLFRIYSLQLHLQIFIQTTQNSSQTDLIIVLSWLYLFLYK